MADDDSTTDPAAPPATDDATPPAQTPPEEPKPSSVPPEVERALRKANKEAETLRLKLKEIEDRDKTEAQRLAERVEAAERELAKERAQSLRQRVALAKGLPATLAARLQGEDEDALMADADALLALTGPKRPAPDSDQGPRPDGGPRQWTEADLKGKSPEQIDEAFNAGLLNDVMSARS